MSTGLSLNAQLIWWLMGVLALADVALLKVVHLSVAPAWVLPVIAVAAGLLALSVVCTKIYAMPRLASYAHMMAAMAVFSIAAMILSYTLMAMMRPLVDDSLVAFDRMTGLRWLQFYQWSQAHNTILTVLEYSYSTLLMQPVALLVILNAKGMTERGWELVWIFMAASLACILTAGPWPAAGAFGHFHVEEESPYVRAFVSVRDGTLKTIGPGAVPGIIQFPSLHAALAVVYIYIARGIVDLFPFLLGLNALLLVSTAPVGGHHFVDVWAGVILAFLAIAGVRCARGRRDAMVR